MARQFTANADSVAMTLASSLTLGAPFTVWAQFKPADLAQATKDIWTMSKASGARFGMGWEHAADRVSFGATGFSGTDPFTSSGLILTSAHLTSWAKCLYRYQGSAAEWAKWLDGAKTVINASITFGLPTGLTHFYAGRNAHATTNAALGVLAEVAIWSLALTDEEIAELNAGIAPDQIARGALAFYAPMRGSFGGGFEREYTRSVSAVSITGTTAPVAHPNVEAPLTLQTYRPAWALDVFHPDGTLRAASVDLHEDTDFDALGNFYPGDILNGDSIAIVEEHSDGAHGIWTPGVTTVLVKPGPTYRDVVLADEPTGYWRLAETSGTTAADETDNALDGSYAGTYSLDTRGGVDAHDADGRAVGLSGASGSFVSVPDNGLLDITGNLTLEAWVYLNNRSDYYFIVTKNTSNAGPQAYEWRVETGTGKPEFVHATAVIVRATNAVPLGGWHHVAVTRSGSTITHYLDGNPNGSGTIGGTAAANSRPVYFGTRDEQPSSSFLHGALCHVAIYAHVLAAAALAFHYRVGVQPWKGRYGRGREWRGVRALLRRYDRESHEVANELSGVIVDFDHAQGAISIGTEESGTLGTLIPRVLVNSDDFPTATDLGAAVPVVFGTPYVTPPYAARDPVEAVSEYAVCHLENADGTNQAIRIEGVWADIYTDTGLESLDREWIPAPGSPAFHDPNEFSVTGDQRDRYPQGTAVRYKTTASPTTFKYSSVVSYNTGVSPHRVTIADSDLDSGLTAVGITGAYDVRRDSLFFGADALLSIQIEGDQIGAVVAKVTNPEITNPAYVVKEILRNARWGLGQAVDNASFDAAATALSSAGLGSGINGALAYNRQQRSARAILSEILSVRGMRLRFDAELAAWTLTVDSAPASVAMTLGYADGVYQNVTRVRSVRRRSLSEATKTLQFHFGVLGRARPSPAFGIALLPQEYKYFCATSVLGVGETRSIGNPYVNTSTAAKRACLYQAKSMRYSDEGVEIDAGREARKLRPGSVVRYVDPHHGFDEDMRVWRTSRRLIDVGLTLRGYDPDTFAFSEGEVDIGTNANTDVTDIDETRRTRPGTGGNYLSNPDFSAPVRSGTVASTMIPGWLLAGTSEISAASIVSSDAPKLIGGFGYLQIVTTGVSQPPGVYSLAAATGSSLAGLAIVPGTRIIFSVYSENTTGGWRFRFFWVNAAGTLFLTQDRPLFAVGLADQNGLGWQRWYSRGVAPANAAYVYVQITMDRATGTYKFDAPLLEVAGAGQRKPSPWRRNPPYGIEPGRMGQGGLLLRPPGQAEGGLLIEPLEFEQTAPSGTNTWDFANAIPANSELYGVTGKVTTAFGAIFSLNVGTIADPTLFAALISPTLGTAFGRGNHSGSFKPLDPYAAATTIRVTANGANFNGTGKLKIVVNALRSIAPV